MCLGKRREGGEGGVTIEGPGSSQRTDVPPSSMEAETKEWFYNYICAGKNSKCFYSLESFEKSTFEQN